MMLRFVVFLFVSLNQTVAFSTMALENVQAVIFDVDGTLADSGKLGFDATNVILDRHQIAAIDYAEYCRCTRYTTPDRLARHAGLDPGTPEFEQRGETLGNEFDNLYIDLVSPETAGYYPGILQLVENIPQDVKVGAVTNAAGRYAQAVLNRNPGKLQDRFTSVLGADQVPQPKPHPDGLLQACRELNVSPETAVYIGDSPSDGLAAHAAGMRTIGVTWGAHSYESLQAQCPHFLAICNSVDELQRFLPQAQATL